jgi:CheY-specific phosphatase CheX
MSQPIAAADIQEYVVHHMEAVFETMLSLKAIPGEANPLEGERVTGSVGMAGDKVTGRVYLHLPAAFATQATAAMLGLAPEDITGHDEVNDVTGEVTNMLAGGLKSWFCDRGAKCALTTPAVIRGTSFAVSTKPGIEHILIGFGCNQYRGQIEVHVKLN